MIVQNIYSFISSIKTLFFPKESEILRILLLCLIRVFSTGTRKEGEGTPSDMV